MGMTKSGLKGPLTIAGILAESEAKINLFIARKGRPPHGSREWDKEVKSPSRHTVQKYCDMTIEQLLVHFGYEPVYKSYHPKWTEEGILDQALRSITGHLEKHGAIPGSREWEDFRLTPTKPTIKAVMNLSINQLIKRLGFEPKNSAGLHYTDQKLIEFLHICAKAKGDMPRISDFLADRPAGYPSVMVYYYRFGSFVDALKSAGFDYTRGFSKEYLRQRMQDFIDEFQRAPYPYELDGRKRPKGYPKGSTYVHAFGSVEECLKQMNRAFAEQETTQWTKESIAEAVTKEVTEYMGKNGRIIQSGEWDLLRKRPSRGAIRTIMECGFNELLIQLGFTPSKPSPFRYTDEELLGYIKQHYADTAEQATVEIFREHDDLYPDPINYQRRFGSWDNAMIQAGMHLNSGMRGKRSIADDGHHCDSIRERIVDDFLYKHGIAHERNVLYPRHSQFNQLGLRQCDFLLRDHEGNPVFVEYAGMNTLEYLTVLEEKQMLAKVESLRLIIVKPKDLKTLSIILREWIKLEV